MGSNIRKLEYDAENKTFGPRCHRCGAIMKLLRRMMYGNKYICPSCSAIFQEDSLP